jgi:RimJ/RimL family protein N-acetyltransferase
MGGLGSRMKLNFGAYFCFLITNCLFAEFEIIKLDPDRWKEYKVLRLESLLKYPENFRASYEEEANYTDEQWRDWLQESQQGKRTLFLFVQDSKDQRLIGMAGIRFGQSARTNHVATLFSVYVKPEEQGKGIAKILLYAILDKLKKLSISKISLIVSNENESAKKLYKKLGFISVAVLKKRIKSGGKFC